MAHYSDILVCGDDLEQIIDSRGKYEYIIFDNCSFLDVGFHKFPYRELSCIEFYSCKFYGEVFEMVYVMCDEVRFINCDFKSVRFLSINFKSADFTGSIFRNCSFELCCLEKADMSNCTFIDTPLSENILGVNLSQSKGLLNPLSFMYENFATNEDGFIVFKAFGETFYKMPAIWEIKEGLFLNEEVNYNRTEECGCGVNFATRDWIEKNFSNSFKHITVWECLLHFRDLALLCVPYKTDGKARCGRLQLIKRIW